LIHKLRQGAFLVFIVVAVSACKRPPPPPQPKCTTKLVDEPLPSDWASWPTVAQASPRTSTKRREGITIETSRHRLGPFLLQFESFDTQTPQGYEILEADCAGPGFTPRSGDPGIAFYMLGTSALRQKDNVFVMVVRGSTKDLAVAFSRR
jgi:hypothetical protein